MSTDSRYSNKELAVVLDTTALLAKYYRFAPRLSADILVPIGVVSEVKDAENRLALEEAINLNIVEVISPQKGFKEQAFKLAQSVGCLHKLSSADLEVVATSLEVQRKYAKVIVITDDYELQNLLMYIGVSFKPLRTRGISELRVFAAYCPVCKYVPSRPGEETCPLCGSKIIRARTT
ncbi:MAG: PIN domain-containing protein [Desulfurococcaceae archaeon]